MVKRDPENTVVFICSGLNHPGGTERAIANTANLMQSKGQQVCLLVLDKDPGCFYNLHHDIKLYQHDLHFGLTPAGNAITRKLAFRTHIRRLRKILNELNSSIIISTDYVFTIATFIAVGKSTKKIFAWEHHHFNWIKKSGFWNFLFKKVYPFLTAVICLNKSEAELYKRIKCRTLVIPNFIETGAPSVLDKKTLLSIGWLIKRKGVDLIPSIAKNIFEQNKDWQWHIIGLGEEKGHLQNAIDSLDLSEQVRIIEPFTPDVNQAYIGSSIYIMTSRFECLPMVLLEAMAHGIPCISFDCPTGPAYIINNHVDGILVGPENTEAMSNAIKQLMNNEALRKQMGLQAHKNVKRFSPEQVYPLWESVVAVNR